MKKKIFNVLFAVVLGISFSLIAAPAIAASATLTINEKPSPLFPQLIPDQAYVIKDNVNYKLYYAGSDFASINLAQSPDGITWTPYGGNPIISDGQYHADVKYYSTGFPGANSGTNPSSITMYYRMWYAGLNQNSISGWRYAESPDGITWYNHISVSQFGTPVYSAATGVTYGIADVVYTPGATNTGTDWIFRIYANVQWEIGTYSGKELVVMAFSSDGYNWTGYDPTSAGYATPVFAGTLVTGDFDCDHIGWFKVIKNSPTDWEAFYSGGKDTTYKAFNGIGYATSTDGINWTRRQTLFTTSDAMAWRNQSVWMPSVVKTGSNYQIWFLGSDNPDLDSSDWIQWKLGGANLTVAPNPTPCDWVEYSNNPVFGQWLPGGIKAYYPKVIYDANQFSTHGDSAYYKMWFGSSSGIGYAYSNDGISWTDGANPVTGPVGGAGHPLVEYDPNGFGQGIYYKLWYWTGSMTYSINDLRYAESGDGINWTNDQVLTQDSILPLVTGNSGPDWNAGSYGPCDIIYSPSGSNSLDDINLWNNKYVMYYMGTTGGNEFIGIAYSANGTFWKRYGNDPVLSPCTLADDPDICWDYYSVGYCSVINLSGSWQMWYGGGEGTNHGIGYATSTNGISWTKHPDNPIFHISDNMSWRNDRTYTPWVLYDIANFDGHGDACPYKMWYSGRSTDGKYSVGYARATPVDAGPDQDVCEGGSPISLIGASPSGGTWSGTGVSGSDFNPTGLLPGPYIVTYNYTSATGCSSNDNKTVTINTRPIVDAGPEQTITSGGSAVIGGSPTASGGMPPYSYSWTPTAGLNNSTLANPTASPIVTTNYMVTVTDNKGCMGSDNMTLSVQSPSPAGGGGGGITSALAACPVSLTADMEGSITIASMSGEGVLCNTCIARDASGKYTLEMDEGTQLLLADNAVPRLLEFHELSTPPPTPENTVLVGPAYEINAYPTSYATIPSQVTISPPAMLTLTYDPKELSENAIEVYIANYDQTKGWQALAPVPGAVAELGKAQGLASHFSPIAVLARLAEPKPAAFNISGLTIVPARAQLNQEITIRLKVTNTGQQSGDYNVQVKVDGQAIPSKEVTVTDGASQTVNLTIAGYAHGKHKVEIAGLNSEFEIIGASSSTDTQWWFFGGVAALILVAIGLLIALRK
jgi:hypothetical protein